MYQYIVTVYFKYNIAEHIVTCVLETLHSTPTDFPSKQKSKHAVYVREYKSIRYSMVQEIGPVWDRSVPMTCLLSLTLLLGRAKPFYNIHLGEIS